MQVCILILYQCTSQGVINKHTVIIGFNKQVGLGRLLIMCI